MSALHASHSQKLFRIAVHAVLLLLALMISFKTVQGTNQDGVLPRVVLVGLMLVLSLTFSAYRLSAALYAYLLVTPFYNVIRRIYYASDTSAYASFETAKLTDPLVALPAVLFILTLLGSAWITWRGKTIKCDESYRLIARPLGVFILLGIIAGLARPSVSALMHLVLYGLSPLAFYVPARLLSDSRSVKHLFAISLFTGFLTALYALKQTVIGLADFETAWVYGTGFYSATTGTGLFRIFSTMNSQGHFADFMIATILIGVSSLTMRIPKSLKVFTLVSLPLMAYGLLSAMVRSSWFGLAAGLVFMFGVLQVKKPSRRPSRIFLLGVVLACMLAFGGTKGDSQSIEPQSQSKAKTYNQLILDQKQTIADPLSAPTIESRMGRIADAAPWVLTHPLGQLAGAEGPMVENYYFDTAVNLGWIGLGALSWCIFLILRHGIRIYDSLSDRDLRAVTAAGLSLLVSLLVAGFAGPHITVQPVAMYLWLFLGAIPLLPAMDIAAKQDEAGMHNGE